VRECVVDYFDPMPDRRSPGAIEMDLAADVGGDDQVGMAAFKGIEAVVTQLPGQRRLGQ